MEALASIAAVLCIIGNAILGTWCCIWGSARRLAAGLLVGWALVTAVTIPVFFVMFGSNPVLPLAYALLWLYYAAGTGLFVYFVKMILASDHIRNS